MGSRRSPASRDDCPICRSLDSSVEERRIYDLLRLEAEAAGVSIWRLPDPCGLRFAVAEQVDSDFVRRLEAACSAARVTVTQTTQEVANNQYEFDQVEFV